MMKTLMVKKRCRSSQDGCPTSRAIHSPLMQTQVITLALLLLMLPRVLQRPNNKRLGTRIAILNCRTLLDDERLDELDNALLSISVLYKRLAVMVSSALQVKTFLIIHLVNAKGTAVFDLLLIIDTLI